MIRRPLRAALLAAVLALPLPVTVTPAQAQWTVFDPWNYAQNILSAARALDQINNQIVSLQNEAQMLVNQSRNLTSLPYSSLARLQQSFARTEMLIARAQRLAYNVTDIERAFASVRTLREPASDSLFDGGQPDQIADETLDRVEALLSPTPAPRNEIARALNVPVAQVAAALLELSLTGRAELLPGGLASL